MKSRKGFTLIELLVVIAIILLLAAILFPIFKKAREQARKNTCQAHMVQIGKAIKSYLVDNEDTFPTNYSNPPPPPPTLADGRPNPADWTITTLKVPVAKLTSPIPGSSNISKGNWVEGLQPYIEKLEDMRSRETMMKCPAASSNKWPSSSSWESATAQNLVCAAITYSLNWYLAGENESNFPELSNTLMLRELDRLSHALLRPCPPVFAPGTGITGRPIHWSPAFDSTGGVSIPSVITSTDITSPTVDPNRHIGGSIMVFGDGHSRWIRTGDASSALVNDNNLNGVGGATDPDFLPSQGWRTQSAKPFWICPP